MDRVLSENSDLKSEIMRLQGIIEDECNENEVSDSEGIYIYMFMFMHINIYVYVYVHTHICICIMKQQVLNMYSFIVYI